MAAVAAAQSRTSPDLPKCPDARIRPLGWNDNALTVPSPAVDPVTNRPEAVSQSLIVCGSSVSSLPEAKIEASGENDSDQALVGVPGGLLECRA